MNLKNNQFKSGGSNTNLYGKLFEKNTEMENILLKEGYTIKK